MINHLKKPLTAQQMHMINLLCDFNNALLEDEIKRTGLWDGISAKPKITNELLCKIVGINTKTLWTWMNGDTHQNFRDKLDEMHKERFRATYKMVDKQLLNKALRGDTTAMKLFYQLNSMLNEQSTVNVKNITPTEIIINEWVPTNEQSS